MINFAWPYFFLLLPLPAIFYLLFPQRNYLSHEPLKFPLYQQCKTLLKKQLIHRPSHRLYFSFLFLIWFCLILAAMRPQWLGETIRSPNTGRDLMLAIDISGSMKTSDLQWKGKSATRLYVIKQVISDFINKRKGDRIGLILFGSKAYQLSPLTMALKTTKTFLQEAMIGMAGNQTAIGDAIGLSIKRLIKRKNKTHVLILITDGVNTAGEVSPLKAAKLAAKYKIKIYTIGVGANSLTINGFFGPQQYNPSENLDEKTLTRIAEITGGQFFRATNSQELEKIYSLIDQQEKIIADPKLYRPIKELYMWPLGLAYFLSLIASYFFIITHKKRSMEHST